MRAAQAVMADLAASGLTPAQLALVIELSATVAAEARPTTDKAAENKREYDREYQREKRKNRTTSYDTNDNRALVSPNKEAPQTPKEINPLPCVRNARVKGKHPLPANWNPLPLKADGQAGVIAARKPAGWIERELSKFKDHALQNNRQCSDWDAAWRNWIKQADEFDGQRNSLGRNQPADGLSPTTRAARDVFGLGASH